MHHPVKIIGLLIDLCWLAFIVYWIAKFRGNKKSIRKGRSSLVNLFRIAVFFLAFGVAWVAAKHYGDTPIIPHTKITQIFGVALCAFGVGYTIWARKVLGANWSAYATIKENHELVQTGPYAITRHPIYTGLIAVFLGTFLAVVPTLAGLGFILFGIAGLYFKLRKEEQLMMETFPNDYPAYKLKVKSALIPFLF